MNKTDNKKCQASQHPLDRVFICVKHRDGWCATKRKKGLQYVDHIPTICGMVVTLPFGIEKRLPDCPECLKELGI